MAGAVQPRPLSAVECNVGEKLQPDEDSDRRCQRRWVRGWHWLAVAAGSLFACREFTHFGNSE